MDTARMADLGALLHADADVASPVLRVILDRATANSAPGARTDDHVVCLAVEGGGMRGAVSAGMCVTLEAAGLIPAFDRIYGVSAGALNGWATAAGQAATGAAHYRDAASRRVINPMRALLGRAVIDFDFLFGELIGMRRPLSFTAMKDGPDLRALATSLETLSLRVLRDFGDADEVSRAVRASAALPRLGGPPPLFRGERMADGGMIEAIPYETALHEGATHVLVLRSRPAAFRASRRSEVCERVAVCGDPALTEVLRRHSGGYNRQAADLARLSEDPGSPVAQIAPPALARLIGRLEPSPAAVDCALRLGAEAMSAVLLAGTPDSSTFSASAPGSPASSLRVRARQHVRDRWARSRARAGAATPESA